MQDECELEGWSDYLNFSVGNYYEWPNEKAPNFGTAPNGFIDTTYKADIIMMLPRANSNWSYNYPVKLPSPNHFEGKIVKVMTSRSVTSVDSGAAIKIGSVKSNCIALGFYANATGTGYSPVSINDTITIDAQTNVELMAINGYWIVMDMTTKA